jgi:hypothetical protein
VVVVNTERKRSVLEERVSGRLAGCVRERARVRVVCVVRTCCRSSRTMTPTSSAVMRDLPMLAVLLRECARRGEEGRREQRRRVSYKHKKTSKCAKCTAHCTLHKKQPPNKEFYDVQVV